MLDSIRSPLDLRKLPEEELPKVAAEIREFMLDRLSKSG
jgi:1-deoxy-D-xylulose-5-phosphate synthase